MRTEPIISSAEAILAKADETAAKGSADPLRIGYMEVEHRLLRKALFEVLEHHAGHVSEYRRLLRLVSMLRDALTRGFNGSRYWIPSLPAHAKTALTLIGQFLSQHEI